MKIVIKICCLLLLLLLVACATGRTAFDNAQQLERNGKYDEAVIKYAEAVANNPDSGEYRLGYLKSSEQAAMLQLLVRRRVAAGVNQTALAARLGITQSEVSKFERGERALDPRRLRAWLHALEVEWTPLARALDRASGREDACVE